MQLAGLNWENLAGDSVKTSLRTALVDSHVSVVASEVRDESHVWPYQRPA
jgi:hypothetical protein